MGIDNLDQKMAIAKANPKYSCYQGSHMERFHTVGCPHQEWTVDQLQRALETQMALVRVYQHELFGIRLDGEPTVVFYNKGNGDQSGLPKNNVKGKVVKDIIQCLRDETDRLRKRCIASGGHDFGFKFFGLLRGRGWCWNCGINDPEHPDNMRTSENV